jgi:parallel beta-helix repeat protein
MMKAEGTKWLVTVWLASAMVLCPIMICIDVHAKPINNSTFAGGSGTISDPYIIQTLAELQNIRNNTGANYSLANDIDASVTTSWNWNGTVFTGFNPIGIYGPLAFRGRFEGNHHEISNLYHMSNPITEGGLFGCVGSTGLVCNISVINANITGQYRAGVLVGENLGTIKNAYTSGYVCGVNLAGGLAGTNTGSISDCTFDGVVRTPTWTQADTIGGLIGRNSGPVSNCLTNISVIVDNDISASDHVGGLIGMNYAPGNISNCHSIGYVSVNGTTVGGLVGSVASNCFINNCSFNGTVLGYTVGGLVGSASIGVNITNSQSKCNINGSTAGGIVGINIGTITFSQSIVNITGTSIVGGLVGWNRADVKNSSSSGRVNGSTAVGGLVGDNDNNITDCHSNTEVSGSIWVGGLVGDNEGNITSSFSQGNITGNDRTGGLVGQTWSNISNCYFIGNVTGRDEVGGFVGLNTAGASITNSHSFASVYGRDRIGGFVGECSETLFNCYSTGDVVATGNYVGGLVGDGGMITNCYSTCNVTGNSSVGGLAGRNLGDVTSKSYSTGNITGITEYIGGLIGQNSAGTVTNTYSTGAVNGTAQRVGGLIGYNWGVTDVTNSYSTGNITGNDYVGGLIGYNWLGSVNNCFWDIQSSGNTWSWGGTPKNTSEMMTQLTFTSAGWNFIDIWWIDEAISYPYLRLGPLQHAPIRINSNVDFDVAHGVLNWNSGDGSLGNPWIIGGWDINGYDEEYCIYVGNTTDYFIIKNCYLHDANGPSNLGNPYFGDTGIILFYVTNGTIENVNVTDNMHGILLAGTRELYFFNNSIDTNYFGILFDSYNRFNTFVNNTMIDDGFHIIYNGEIEYWTDQYIDTSNTVNGKPVYYWKNLTSGIIPLDAGQVILVNCSDINVSNLSIELTDIGISIGYCKNINISNNEIQGHALDWGQSGIYLYGSENNTVYNNTVTNYIYGICASLSMNNLIDHNLFDHDGNGIIIKSGYNNTLANNTIENSGEGIDLEPQPNSLNIIHNNKIWNNSRGIRIISSSNNLIFNNSIWGNYEGINISYWTNIWTASNNSIYYNSIIGNLLQANDSAYNFWNLTYPFGGNFWSDYNGVDLFSGIYQDVSGSDGFGDTPYVIDGDTQDRFPLMEPMNDFLEPISSVSGIIPYWLSSSPLIINASAYDIGGSDISDCTLWFRYSSDNLTWSAWLPFGKDLLEPWSWSFGFPEGDGYYEFFTIANDTRANTESMKNSAETRCAFDTQAPTVDAGINVFANNLFLQNASTGDAISGLATYSWTKQSGPGNIIYGTPNTEDTTIQANLDGSYVIRLTVTDNAGNAAFDEFNLTWDTIGPIITLNNPSNNSIISGGTVLDFDIEDTNLKNADYFINTGMNITFSNPYDIYTTGWSDGLYTIKIQVNDNAGNNISKSYTFTIDSTYPDIVLNTPTNNSIIQPGMIIDFSIIDDHLNTVNYSFNGGINQTLNAPYDINTTGWVDGIYVIEVHAIDILGQYTRKSYSFTVDGSSPTIISTTPADNSVEIAIDTTIQIEFNESMNTSSVELAISVEPMVTVSGYTWPNNATIVIAISGNFRCNTSYTITVNTMATDIAGNSLASQYAFSFTTLSDTDGDGIPDIQDPDDDNDEVNDTQDAFPLDQNESVDTDNDGIGNNADTDDDGDGNMDEWEIFLGTNPLDPNSKPTDTDGDGKPDGDAINSQPWMDTDDDGDGVSDELDPNPLDPTVTEEKGIVDYWWILIPLLLAGVILGLLFLKKKPKVTAKPELATEKCSKCGFDIEKGIPCPFCTVDAKSEPPKPKPVAKSKPQKTTLTKEELIARIEKAYKEGKMTEEAYLRNMEKFK